ncbi:acetyltransferase [Fimbriimonas ginsengisoli]|nr:acetyltransferase [Fimbriimonas ginsengisoli]
MRPVVLLGAGGHAKVVVAACLAQGVPVLALVSDDPKSHGTTVMGIEVVEEGDLIARFPEAAFAIAIGNNRVRKQISERLDLPWATIMHPSVIVEPGAAIGEGTVVLAGAIVQPDAIIGRHVILNTGCSVDHDARVGDFSHVAPRAALAGGVILGEGVLFGCGACTTPYIEVGDWASIGAGAAVVDKIAMGTTAVGVPARPLERYNGR